VVSTRSPKDDEEERRYAAAMTKTSAAMIEEAKAFGITVTLSTGPKGTGEIVLLPGVRPSSGAQSCRIDNGGSHAGQG
jgi:hypothetical protein